MSAIILTRDQTVEVWCGDKRFTLCAIEDDTLYVEAVGHHEIEVIVSGWDDDDDQVGVKARGQWAHINITSAEDVDGD